ncbi:MAG: hypothetical protein ABMB14_28570, partial [Myxococcota bacterium]
GLPLGIEVAASALAKLDLAGLVDRLRAAVPEPLRAVLSTAIERLDPMALRTLTHLCVFQRSFTRAAATAILGVPSDGLDELIDASLVSLDPTPGRYRLLRPVIALLTPDWRGSREREGVARAYRDHYAALADAWRTEPPGAEALAPEVDELLGAAGVGPADDGHAAILFALHRGWVLGLVDPEQALAAGAPLAAPATQVALMRCHAEVVGLRHPYERACAVLEQASAFARAHGLDAAAVGVDLEWCLLSMASRPAPGVRRTLDACEAALRSLGARSATDGDLAAVALVARLARARLQLHDGQEVEAGENLAWVRSRAEALGDRVTASAALEHLAMLAGSRGDVAAAVRLLDDAIALAERAGLTVAALIRRDNRANLLLPDVGRAPQTERELVALEADTLASGLLGLYGSVRLSRAILALDAGDHDAAGALLADSHALRARTERVNLLTCAEGLLGVLAHDRGRRTEAVGHYARAQEHSGYRAGMWAALAAFAQGQSPAAAAALDPRSGAVARAAADPGQPRDPAFYQLGWWPALDRILVAPAV